MAQVEPFPCMTVSHQICMCRWPKSLCRLPGTWCTELLHTSAPPALCSRASTPLGLPTAQLCGVPTAWCPGYCHRWFTWGSR